MVPGENGVGSDHWPGLLGDLAAEVRRVARRLGGLSEPRLRRPLPPYGTVVDAGRRLAAALAAAAAGVEARAAAVPPPPRAVPELAATAVGDQVAVTGHDLVRALELVGPDEQVWCGDRRASAGTVAAELHRLTHETKLAID